MTDHIERLEALLGGKFERKDSRAIPGTVLAPTMPDGRLYASLILFVRAMDCTPPLSDLVDHKMGRAC